MPGDHSVSGIKISSFDTAQNIKTSDLITGLQDRENKNFTFGTILAWFRQTIEDFYIAVSEKGRANGVASLDGAGKVTDTQIPFSSNNPLMDGTASAGTATTLSRSDHRHPSDTSKISASEKGAASGVASLGADGKVPGTQLPSIPTQPSDIGAQPTITANGILKGDGQGGVSAATPGTDYATPDMIPTTPADIGALPSEGTAVGSYRMMYVHSITGAAGWYHFLDISTAEGQSRVIHLLIDNGQSSVSGILRIYMYRTGSGPLASTSIVNWMTTTIPIDYVRWTYSNGVTSFYVYKSSSTDRAVTFTVLSAINRGGTNLAPSILEWDNVSVSEPTTATPATANILNNAATATNALNDGNGDQIDTTYLKTTEATKLVRFTAQAVSVASGAEIFRITDSDITTDTEVVSVEFADPSYITAGGSWTSYAGYVAFTGTCTAATTADVILKI